MPPNGAALGTTDFLPAAVSAALDFPLPLSVAEAALTASWLSTLVCVEMPKARESQELNPFTWLVGRSQPLQAAEHRDKGLDLVHVRIGEREGRAVSLDARPLRPPCRRRTRQPSGGVAVRVLVQCEALGAGSFETNAALLIETVFGPHNSTVPPLRRFSSRQNATS